MKNIKKLMALLLLIMPLQLFAYGEYEFSSDDSDYYTNDYYGTDSYNDNYGNYYRPSHRRQYDGYAHRRYIGGGKVFVFDPRSLEWYAYYNGSLVHSGRASGGKHYCPDIHRPCRTPVGVFRVTSKGGADCKSSKYPVGKGNAPMPWCMFFHRGYAIHGSYDVPGYNASHGCIRVHPLDAQWLNYNFMSPGTKVVVRSY